MTGGSASAGSTYTVVLRKTVTETDMVLFAGITGDFAPNHTDEEFMRNTPFGRRQIHGALLVGFMSAVAAKAITTLDVLVVPGKVVVSQGYDRIRFLRSVFPGETLECRYRISGDHDGDRAMATVEVTADGQPAAVADHILRWVPMATEQDEAQQ